MNNEQTNQVSAELENATTLSPVALLLEQLRIQRDGLTMRLDALWPQVGPQCGWLGGPGDCGESAPQYLAGLVALAWTLDDEALKAKAMAYIEWILASQREDGWFGPAGNEDHWPLVVALKQWIDGEYEDGRQTTLSTAELETKIEE